MLKKKHRLAKTTDVKRTFERGRSFLNPLFSIRFLAGNEAKRFTVVVSSKVSKKAVVRNRLRRKVREFVRTRLVNFLPGDYVIGIKPKVLSVTEGALINQLKDFLSAKKLLRDEKNN